MGENREAIDSGDVEKYIPCIVMELTPKQIVGRDLSGWSIKKMFEVVEPIDLHHSPDVHPVACFGTEAEADERARRSSQGLAGVREILVLTDGSVGFRVADEGAVNLVVDNEKTRQLEERIRASQPYDNQTYPGLKE